MNQSLQFKRLALTPMGSYEQQYLRPYTAVLPPLTGEDLIEAADNPSLEQPAPGRGFGAIIRQYIQLGAPEQGAAIPGGWSTPRYAFELEVECYLEHTQSTLRCVLVGYTDRQGQPGQLEPALRLYLNTVYVYRSSGELMEAHRVLQDTAFQGVFGSALLHRGRPEDLFAALSALDALGSGLEHAIDMRTVMTTVPCLSALRDTVPALYLHSVLRAYLEAHRMLKGGERFGYQELLNVSRGLVASQPFSRLPGLTQLSGGQLLGHFTLEQLLSQGLQPGQVQIHTEAPQRRMPQLPRVTRGQWSENDETTQAAAVLLQAMPHLLASHNLTAVDLRAHNREGAMHLEMNFARCARLELSEQQKELRYHFEQQLRDLVLDYFTNSDETVLNLRLEFDCRGESRLQLRLHGGDTREYVSPTFCDSLFAPVLLSKEQLTEMASQMRLILEPLTDTE